MRLVVGSLPASVYWRRRATVLGGVVLAVLIVMYSCNAVGKSSPGANPPANPTAKSTAGPEPSATPSPTDVVPVGQVTASPTAVSVGDPQLCTDDELSITAAPEKTTIATGSSLVIRLFIKNISNRSCVRDVGADHQELRIVLGTEKIWSSDDCGGPVGSDVRTLPPNHERSYVVTWNGKSSVTCSQAAKPAPNGTVSPGEYEVIARVGTDRSDPVTLRLT